MIVRWGVIGTGGIADKKTIPAIKESKDSELIALMDINLERTKELAQKHGAKRYYNKIEDLLSDKEIDAVYIATPLYLHCEQTILAAKYGKHILCEKPMALTVEECKEMIKACKDNQVKLMIGFRMRFHVYHQKIKSLIEEGLLGKIVMGRTEGYLWFEATRDSWRINKVLGGGGALIDLGEHSIDLLRYFIGDEVVEVVALSSNVNFDYPVEDTISVILKFEGGAHSIITSSFAIPYRENLLQIYGTKGSVLGSKTIGQFPDSELKGYINGQVKEYHIEHIDTFNAEIQHFAECIRDNKEPLVTGEDGLKATEIRLAAYESAKKGKAIRMNSR